MTAIRLFSARACPFAHRTRLVLSHKQIPFELVEIDLKNKPAWFDSRVSGYGKVPALEHGEVRLWESAVVNEYINEVFPQPDLLPKAAAERAIARIYIDYANTRFAPAFGKLLRATTSAEQAGARGELLDALTHLEGGFAQHGGSGPFFFGAEPSLVDFAIFPWFERWSGIAHYRGFDLSDAHTRIQRFIAAARELPAVREHSNPPEYYVERYRAIAEPTAHAAVA